MDIDWGTMMRETSDILAHGWHQYHVNPVVRGAMKRTSNTLSLTQRCEGAELRRFRHATFTLDSALSEVKGSRDELVESRGGMLRGEVDGPELNMEALSVCTSPGDCDLFLSLE